MYKKDICCDNNTQFENLQYETDYVIVHSGKDNLFKKKTDYKNIMRIINNCKKNDRPTEELKICLSTIEFLEDQSSKKKIFKLFETSKYRNYMNNLYGMNLKYRHDLAVFRKTFDGGYDYFDYCDFNEEREHLYHVEYTE